MIKRGHARLSAAPGVAPLDFGTGHPNILAPREETVHARVATHEAESAGDAGTPLLSSALCLRVPSSPRLPLALSIFHLTLFFATFL